MTVGWFPTVRLEDEMRIMKIKVHQSIPEPYASKAGKVDSFILKWDMGRFKCYYRPSAKLEYFYKYKLCDPNAKFLTFELNGKDVIRNTSSIDTSMKELK